jgi:monoamine oxidase
VTLGADVVVVGAGVSGLVAADTVHRAGRSVIVLEARDRVGGRTWTTSAWGAPHDLGGQWLGPSQERARAWCATLGLPLFPTWTAGANALEIDGARATFYGSIPKTSWLALAEVELALRRIDRMAARVSWADPLAHPDAAALDATSVASLRDRWLRTRAGRALLDVALGAVFGAEARDMSALFLLAYVGGCGGLRRLVETEGGAQQDRFVGGAQGLALALAARLPAGAIRLSCPARVVNQDGAGVVVTTDDGPVRAQRLVLALPPTARARIDLGVLPAAAQQLTQRMPMGNAVKVFARFPTPWWRDRGLSGSGVSDVGPACFVIDDSPADASHGALLGFVTGDQARRWGRAPEAERHAAFAAQLTRLLGDGPAPDAYLEQDWGADPWSGGGPVALGPTGALHAVEGARFAALGRVHTAGTEAAYAWSGYIEGALRAGERVGAEVVAALE